MRLAGKIVRLLKGYIPLYEALARVMERGSVYGMHVFQTMGSQSCWVQRPCDYIFSAGAKPGRDAQADVQPQIATHAMARSGWRECRPSAANASFLGRKMVPGPCLSGMSAVRLSALIAAVTVDRVESASSAARMDVLEQSPPCMPSRMRSSRADETALMSKAERRSCNEIRLCAGHCHQHPLE